MSNDLRKNMDVVGQALLGGGFANKNDGIGEAPDRGFYPNPEADPAQVAKAWAEVAKRLTPGEWAAISIAAGVSADVLLPRASSDPS